MKKYESKKKSMITLGYEGVNRSKIQLKKFEYKKIPFNLARNIN